MIDYQLHTTPPQFGFLSTLFSSRRKTRSGHFSGIVGRPIGLGTRVKFPLKVLMRRLNELLMGNDGKDGNTPCLFVENTGAGGRGRAPARERHLERMKDGGCLFLSIFDVILVSGAVR